MPGTQQPEYRHSEVVVQDHAASQDQVLLKVVTKQVDAAQPVHQEKVVIKPIHTAQPVHQEKVGIKQVHTAQPVQQEKVETKPVVTAHQVLHYEDPYRREESPSMVPHQVQQYKDHYKGEMFSTMVSHQVLHYEDPYRCEKSPSMVSHHVPQYEDHYKGEIFSTMVSHQVLHYEDPYRREMFSTMVAHHAPVLGQPPQPPPQQQGQVQHQKDPYRGEEGTPQAGKSDKQAADCQISRQAWYKDPKQECEVASLAPSSKEGMSASVVSMSGDYTHTLPDEEAATNPCVTDEAAVINPRESESYHQAQFKKRGVTTDPDSDEDGAKKATKEKLDTTATTMAGVGQKIVFLLNILLALLGNGAIYNQHTAYLTNQVPYSTVTNVMLPSLSWTDANTRPHHIKRVRIRDPGPNEGGARHYAAHHYPYQREGRRHRLGPHQQNGHYYCHCVEEETPPQGPYLVGPPEPFSEASTKQMYFAREQVHVYMNLVQHCKTLKTFTSEVKVVPLTYYEELLIRNRAMYPILCYGYIIYMLCF